MVSIVTRTHTHTCSCMLLVADKLRRLDELYVLLAALRSGIFASLSHVWNLLRIVSGPLEDGVWVQ